MIEWGYFPRNQPVTPLGRQILDVFEEASESIDSEGNDHLISNEYKDSASDIILSRVRNGLEQIGFKVESGKKNDQKIQVPVLFGKGGRPTQSFHADAYHQKEGFVLEVEAGRAVTNYQFLKDLFEATVMVDVNYLGIAVRRRYKQSKDFEKVYSFFETLYASGRLSLPLRGILIIGY